jgi:hypothetical protein
MKILHHIFIASLLLVSSFSIKAQAIADSSKSTATNNIATDSIHTSDQKKTYYKVEVEAEFPGGLNEWRRFLQENINSDIPIHNGAPPGTYKVMVKFIVNHDGNVVDILPVTHFGYGMEEEVIRVLKISPRWIAAIQDGKNVNAYKQQPITFVVVDDRKKK